MKYLAYLAVLAIVGCVADGTGGSTVTVDTLPTGAVVVHNGAHGAWERSTRWSLEHIVRIGAVEDNTPEVFGRVVDVAFGPDSAIYILDGQAGEIRVFDSRGSYLRTIGRRGEGPGEFASPYGIWVDERAHLWVADEGMRRYSRFNLSGELLETLRSPFHGGVGRGQFRVSGRSLWDLELVVRRGENLGIGIRRFQIEDGLVAADTFAFGRWTPTGLARTVNGERFIAIPPWSARRVMDVGIDGSVWVGVGDTYALHRVDRTGDTVWSTLRTIDPILFSDRAVAQLRDWLAEQMAQGFPADPSVLPRAYPYFSRIVIADDGYLWVFREGVANGSGFDVFTPDGRYLGTVESTIAAGSAGTHPHVTGEHLLGVSVDSLGVQYVDLYRIEKPRP